MRRVGIILTLALLAPLALAACGDDDAGGEAGTGAEPGGAEPVTVEHLYGTTTIESPPERIVSLDTQWTDVLVALDAPLVAAALDPSIDGGRFPWQDIPDSVEDIPVDDAIPFEAVAALDPDLIVVSWQAADEGDYELLTDIAPTIPLLGDKQVDAWEDIAAVAGEVLGAEHEAAALVEEAEQRNAELATALPGLEGRTYAMANYVAGDALYVVADPDDGASNLFGQLGLSIDPDLLALADGATGRATLSLEQVTELDADLLVLFTNGADPAGIPGYAALPPVQDGAVAVLDLAAVSGLNTPTPLSLPYSLERIRPALEAAAN
jgi:iron complex transport system substrate-binding protein